MCWRATWLRLMTCGRFFAMRMIEGLDTSATADCLELTESNVKVRPHRARALLRVRIDARLPPETIQEALQIARHEERRGAAPRGIIHRCKVTKRPSSIIGVAQADHMPLGARR